jgi:hypothetical protein
MTHCNRCDGCGQIANSESGEPWSDWLDLPIRSSAAVLAGLVRPISCPTCKGSGLEQEPKPGLDKADKEPEDAQ